MTTAEFAYPIRPREPRSRRRGDRPTVAAARPRRTGMVSEAVVAGYIRELSGRGRRRSPEARRPTPTDHA